MQMGVMLDDLYLTKICNSTAPAQPELTVTPGASGAISCSGTVTVPATDVDGNATGTVAKVEILRQKQKNMKLEYNENPWEPVFSRENVLPGDELTFTDATATEGLYIYKAVASNAYGSGMERKVVTVIGEDIPAAVSGVAVDRLDGNSVSVSWTAPEKGMNGGYISPENLKYVLELNDDYGFRELEGEYTGTCYTVSIPTSDAKSPFSVTIRPYNTTGTGDNAKTTVFTSGNPYTLPFHDSFYLDKNNLEGLPVWICPQVDYRSWMLMSDMSQDGDNYCSVVYMGKSHTTLDMLSSEIDFSDASNAYVEFWYYLEPQYGNPILQTVVSVDYGEWMPVGEEMHLATAGGENPQWKEVKVPLATYDGEKNVRVGLRATSTTPYDMLLIDNFTVDQGWTGVDDAVLTAPMAIAKRGDIFVSGYAQEVRIYNLSGMEVSVFSLEGEKLISVAPGIYIVNMDGTSMKLLVK